LAALKGFFNNLLKFTIVWYRYSQANNPIVWIDKDNKQYVLYIDRNGKQQKVPFDSAQKLGINRSEKLTQI